MDAAKALADPHLNAMVEGLRQALGGALRSVVLYGSAARGGDHAPTSDLNLLVVAQDLAPASLEALGPCVTRWRARGHHAPRLFTPELIAESADVFPIEFLDIRASHVVLHGDDPFAGLEVRGAHLRLQCERELREKLMRLREAYVEAHGRDRDLRRLLRESYTSFLALFRGCLRLLGDEPPADNAAVVAAFCARAGLDARPFGEVEALRQGDAGPGDLKDVFSRYYRELTKAIRMVDRFHHAEGGAAS